MSSSNHFGIKMNSSLIKCKIDTAVNGNKDFVRASAHKLVSPNLTSQLDVSGVHVAAKRFKRSLQQETSWWSQIPNMLNREATSDVTILVDGQRIYAHKLILSLHSPVFEAMFQIDMCESLMNEIVIIDFSADAVMCLLRSLYDPSTIEIGNNPLELYTLADKYGVESIKPVVEQHIRDILNKSNVFEVLRFAELHNLNKVRAAAFDLCLSMLPTPINIDLLTKLLGPALVGNMFEHMRSAVQATKNRPFPPFLANSDRRTSSSREHFVRTFRLK